MWLSERLRLRTALVRHRDKPPLTVKPLIGATIIGCRFARSVPLLTSTEGFEPSESVTKIQVSYISMKTVEVAMLGQMVISMENANTLDEVVVPTRLRCSAQGCLYRVPPLCSTVRVIDKKSDVNFIEGSRLGHRFPVQQLYFFARYISVRSTSVAAVRFLQARSLWHVIDGVL